MSGYLSERGLSDELDLILRVAFKAYDDCLDLNKDPIDYAHLCNTMGIVTHNRGEFAASKFYLQQCHDVRARAPNPEPEEIANIYNNLGNVEFSGLQYDKAIAWHRLAEEIRMPRGDDWTTNKGMTRLKKAGSVGSSEQSHCGL